MIEREKTDAGVYVRIGPFETEAEAKRLEGLLREISADGWEAVRDAVAPIPAAIKAAVRMGLAHLHSVQGHFLLRVDGGPRVDEPRVEYSSGGTFKKSA